MAPPNRARRVGLGILTLGLAALAAKACTSEPDQSPPIEPLPLDEVLGPGQVRAGVISRESELIGGLTARGSVGDYKLYNDQIRVIISRPGAGQGYNPYGGTLLDADVVRPPGVPGASEFGELINTFDLSTLRAEKIELINDGRDGQAARVRVTGVAESLPIFEAILATLFSPEETDIEWTVDYVLEPDARWLRVEQTLWNRSGQAHEFGLEMAGFLVGGTAQPFLEGYGFNPGGSGAISRYHGALGQAVSYLYGRPSERIELLLSISGLTAATVGPGLRLRARERLSTSFYVIVGDGDLSRTQALWRELAGDDPGLEISGRVLQPNGDGVAGSRVHARRLDAPVEGRDYATQARTDEEGRFRLSVEPGEYELTASTPARIIGAPVVVSASAPSTSVELPVAAPGRLRYRVRDELERPLPAKLSIRPEGRAVEPLPAEFGEPTQGFGLIVTEFAHTGEGVLELPAGEYTVFVSRGGEYEVDQQRLTVEAGAEIALESTLVRTVSSPGWLTTDTHIHSQLSPDSPDPFDYKVRAMVVENLEIPISTEHEALGDFNPAIRELGLEAWMKGIIGTEVTTFSYGHFNAFPMVQDFSKPGNGRVDWYRRSPAEIFRATRENAGDPFIQVNHPRAASIGGYFSAIGLNPDDVTARRPAEFSLDFDGIEVMNGCGSGALDGDTVLDWFGFLNNGYKKYATGSTDNHKAVRGEMGLPLTYVRMPTDEPSEAKVDDVRRAFKDGRLVVSCGPFLEMRMGDKEVGDTVPLSGDLVSVEATLNAASWVDLDELLVIANGQVVKRVPLPATENPERFAGTVTASVPPGRDGWVILWARGDRRHGVWARNKASYAFTNPIFIDGDGDGRWGR